MSTATAPGHDWNEARQLIPFRRRRLAAPPAPLTPLLGRDAEVASVVAALGGSDTRLVTLIGPGGIGKTRLALSVATEIAREFDDQVAWAPVTTATTAEGVAAEVAHAIGLTETGAAPTFEALKAALRDMRVLLIIDNCEQALDAAPFLGDLLRSCPAVSLMATSRALLRIAGEHPVEVPTLSTESDVSKGAKRAKPAPAVQLFAERAAGVSPTFALTPENIPVVAEICRRLDGLPLAIELAAERSLLLSPSELLVRLDHRLPHLTAGRRDGPARHRTMREAIAWSYDLLDPEEQRVVRCLWVFAGGCTLEAAEAVCRVPGAGEESTLGHQSPTEISAVIESLTAQSLVRVEPAAGGEKPRLTMLQTIHEFAAERLAASGDEGPRRRHAVWFRELASRVERGLLFGNFPEWSALLAPERANLRAALEWALEEADADTALQLSTTMYSAVWISSAFAQEKEHDLERTLALAGGTPAARVAALVIAARMAPSHFDSVAAEALAEEALVAARQSGDELAVTLAHAALGAITVHTGDETAARIHLGEALEGYRRVSAKIGAGWMLCDLAALDSRDAVDEGGDPEALAMARARYDEAVELFSATEHPRGIARALHGLAYVTYKQRDLPRALAKTQESLALIWELRAPAFSCLEDVADIAGRIGQAETAARLYGAADAERERFALPLEPQYQAEYERDIAISRDALGDVVFAREWAVGRTWTEEQAVAEALALVIPSDGPGGDATTEPVTLSPRESEVMRLVAAGLSDRAIADALFIGERTVNTHVAHIFTKLGVRNRAAAVTAAVVAGLVDPDSVREFSDLERP
jgi:non-specific serine/threonine protein kinase